MSIAEISFRNFFATIFYFSITLSAPSASYNKAAEERKERMKEMSRIAVWIGLLAAVVAVSACGAVPSPENVIQPPGKTGTTADTQGSDIGDESKQEDPGDAVPDLESAILEQLPAGVTLVAPKQPEGAETVQTADLDGDGTEEAVAVYAAQDNPQALHAVLLKEETEGAWSIVWETEGSGFELDYAKFADITGDGKPELLLGWAFGASVGSGLDIFTWQNGEMALLAQQGYHRIEVANLHEEEAGHPGQEIAVWTKDTGNAFAVEVYKWEAPELVPAEEVYPAYFPKVAAYYEELLKETPDAAVLWYYLADAQWKSGSAEEALASLDKARSLDADGMWKDRLDSLENAIKGQSQSS